MPAGNREILPARSREIVPVGRLAPPRAGGVPLPGELRASMERAFDADFSTVRLHSEPRLAQLGARALTRGEHIYFASRPLDLAGPASQALLGEELAHTVQQRQGRVPVLCGQTSINVSPALEREAVNAGARAARGEPAGVASAMAGAVALRGDAIQGSWLGRMLRRLRGQGGGAPAPAPAPALAPAPVHAPAITRTPFMGLSEAREGSRERVERLLQSRWEETTEGGAHDDEKIALDLSRIAGIVLDQRRFEALLVPLDERIEELQEGSGGKLKLGTAIAEYEGRHGFGRKQQIPLGILPGPVFLELMASGVVPKDIGAGLPHGEMSHRIQWVAIMQDFEDNPDAWSMTPLELLQLTNIGPYGWFQGVVLDQAHFSASEGYSHPDNMLRFMRDDAQTRATLPSLSAAIVARWNKRVDQAVAAVNAGKGMNLDPAQAAAYREKKQAEGWSVSSGTTDSGSTWAMLVAPGPDDAPLEERIAEQRERKRRDKRRRERERIARTRSRVTINL